MEVDPFAEELPLPQSVLTILESPLPPSVEALLQKICSDQSQKPPDVDVRKRLAAIGERGAIEILNRIAARPIIRNLSGFIVYLLNRYPECLSEDIRSPKKSVDNRSSISPSPPRKSEDHRTPKYTPQKRTGLFRYFSPLDTPGSSEGPSRPKTRRVLSFCGELESNVRGNSQMISQQLKLLSQLEFRKLFLILSYIGRKKLEDVISPDAARGILELRNLPMTEFESCIWNDYGHESCFEFERPKYLDWDSGKTHMYYCEVDQKGQCTFKGPLLDTTRTHLQRALGDDNVLCVKFPSENECCAKIVADEGILVGVRRYRFFVYKDVKEKKKKNAEESKKVAACLKCYFVRFDSIGQCKDDMSYAFSTKKINEARSHFMHVHTVASMAKYIARFSLILSKTIKFPVNLADVDIQDIEDIPCRDENGHIVLDEDGEPRIHTDGTGFISEDLALRCPKEFSSARLISDGNFEQFQDFSELEGNNMEGMHSWNSEAPLLMQVRLFSNGRAVKGTLLINKQIGPRKIQIRPSMVKVEKDPKFSATSTFNSLEIVAISHKPRRTYLSKYLIALLSYGGVPDEYFLALMESALDETKALYTNRRAALKAAVKYGDIDTDFTTAKLISSGVPLGEPYVHCCLSRLANLEKDKIKRGKLPIANSFYLMGTADPTGVLNSDEVCVILENGHVTGKVLVYKSPGLHFGDIHIMTAKYVQELDHIVGNAKYAIFFSTKGPISAASQIANSDFDGDMYWVSMNPQLLNYYKVSEPWSRVYATPKSVSRRPSEFTPDELEYELLRILLEGKKSSNNNMAVAADSWLACMDRFLTLGCSFTQEKVHLRRKMLHLIDLYYEALDAPKTGKKVDIPPELKPEKYPHYMERKPSYDSTSVLGKLYNYRELSKPEEDCRIGIWKLPCFDVEVPDMCLVLWGERYHKHYLPEMTEAMKCGPEVRNVVANDVIKKYKQLLYDASDFEESRRKIDEIFNEALAIYSVCYDYAKRLNDVKKCSFAWRVAGSALCKYHALKQKGRPFLILPSILQDIL